MRFPDKPFEEFTPDDYARIGLKCGLEVHQQLLTDTKLFCRCPAGRYSSAYDAEILRHMRPTLSELGEYDGTALMEKKTRKNIYYRIHRDTVCTYEFDDTPPFLISDQALDIALQISLLLNLNVVGELHIARKQYLDGSIPTGFQRTAIVGVGGWLPYRGRRIGITQLSIEEDSCREVSDVGHDRVLLTDRLGMPLIETVTDPDMRTPQETADVCEIIRRVCISTGRVRRGYGAAREDVNVSVEGGTRVEIKGVPQIGRIPLLIHNEARRQCALLDIRDDLARRGMTTDSFRPTSHDVTRYVSKARFEPLQAAIGAGLRVKCVLLPGFAGILNTPTQEHTTFAKEFSDRVRVIACLSRLPNIVHSDSATESLAARDWKELFKRTGATAADSLVLVWGNEADTRTACEEIIIRAREALTGIPRDTRQALADGTNGFERVLPGAERMYPDTDLPPLDITDERLECIRASLPAPVWEVEQRLAGIGLSADLIRALLRSGRLALFERLAHQPQADVRFIAIVLAEKLKAYRRAGLPVERLTEDDLVELLDRLHHSRLVRSGVLAAMRYLMTHDPAGEAPARVDAAVAALHLQPATADEVRRYAERLLAETDLTAFPDVPTAWRHLVGRLVYAFRGRISGTHVAQTVAGLLSANDADTATTAPQGLPHE